MKYITRMSFLVILLLAGVTGIAAADEKIPVIYCTDLFHPHDDPDDHFDAACMYAIPEFDIKAVILDQGKRQQQQRGSIPMEQLNGLTGRNVPYVVGLAETLENPEDTGGNQSAEYQDGIKTILSVLRESPEPVTIITVGSLRDVAAAYNREPQLFRDKLYRLYSFIGEAQGVMREYNVGLDIHAYRCIMNSGLPVYWVPCFDGGVWVNEGNASFWKAKHNDLLADVSDTVLNFFIYMAVRKNDPKPMAALYTPVVPKEKEKVLEA
ncbi:MAG: nucleoside hydrolase, partial [Candidatus Hydrogenedentes bacterium]|nr:nucleoside hydrolase [Candidatus Hydrogenedentota bacterium]